MATYLHSKGQQNIYSQFSVGICVWKAAFYFYKKKQWQSYQFVLYTYELIDMPSLAATPFSQWTKHTLHYHWHTTQLSHFGKWPSRTKCLVEIGYHITVMSVYIHYAPNLALTWHHFMRCILWPCDLSYSRYLLALAMIHTAVRQSSIAEMYTLIPTAERQPHNAYCNMK